MTLTMHSTQPEPASLKALAAVEEVIQTLGRLEALAVAIRARTEALPLLERDSVIWHLADQAAELAGDRAAVHDVVAYLIRAARPAQ